MPLTDLTSTDLWTTITQMLDADDEHICVLPMTTFIKPVRSVTVLQVDTKVNATRSMCPPGSKDMGHQKPSVQPPELPDSELTEADNDPLTGPVPQIIDGETIHQLAGDVDLSELAGAYGDGIEPSLGTVGVIHGNVLTVSIEPYESGATVLAQIDIKAGTLLAYQPGSGYRHQSVIHQGGTRFSFTGMWDAPNDTIDIADFSAPRFVGRIAVEPWDATSRALHEAFDDIKFIPSPLPNIVYRNTLTAVYGRLRPVGEEVSQDDPLVGLIVQIDTTNGELIGYEPLTARVKDVIHREGTSFEYTGPDDFRKDIDVANFPGQ